MSSTAAKESAEMTSSNPKQEESHTYTPRMWDDFFDLLKRFHKQHGHCLVPADYPKDPEFGEWVVSQRQNKENQMMTRKHELSLVNIGFSWDPEEDAWDEKCEQLAKYKESHENLQNSDNELSDWMKTQRDQHRLGTLSRRRMGRLNNLGFPWKDDARNDDDGEEMSVYSDSDVSDVIEFYHVKTNNYTTKKSSQAQVAQKPLSNSPRIEPHDNEKHAEQPRLQEEELKCSAAANAGKPEEVGGDETHDQQPTQDKEGSQNSSPRHAGNPNESSDDCNSIDFPPERSNVTRAIDGEQTTKVVEGEEHLSSPPSDDVGTFDCSNEDDVDEKGSRNSAFVGQSQASCCESSRMTFEQSLKALAAYKKEHGNCLVSTKYTRDQKLGNWVKEQRKQRQKNILSQARIDALDELGFAWNPQWDARFDELVQHKRKHGSCKGVKGHLATWVISQRNDKKLGRLSLDRIERLGSIGFDWESSGNGDRSMEVFDNCFKEDIRVRLGKSTFKSEEEADDDSAKDDDDEEEDGDDNDDTISVTSQQSQVLSSKKKSPRGFEQNLKALAAYKKEHGNCLVPYKYAHDVALGNWVALQRRHKRKKKLSHARIKALDRLGFSWNPLDEQWNARFEEYFEYKQKHGTSRVGEGSRSLYAWALNQRRHKRLGTLSKERIARLSSIGFDWRDGDDYGDDNHNMEADCGSQHSCQEESSEKGRHSEEIDPLVLDSDDSKVAYENDNENAYASDPEVTDSTFAAPSKGAARTWNESLVALACYKRKYGNCLVPQGFAEDPSLGTWVSHQRYFWQRNELCSQRINALDKLGFSWQPLEDAWNKKWGELQQIQKENGSCSIPRRCVKLHSWANTQRWMRKKGRLSAERIRKLDSLGFDWKSSAGHDHNSEDGAEEVDCHSFKEEESEGDMHFQRNNRLRSLSKKVNIRQSKHVRSQQYLDRGLEVKHTDGHDNNDMSCCDSAQTKEKNRKRKSSTTVKNWDENLQALAIYKEKFGNCLVPRGYFEDPSLGHWVRHQRDCWQKRELSQQRINALDKLGFSWQPYEDSWNEKLLELKRYKQEHGTCNVPRMYGQLHSWVGTQRRMRKEEKLSAERITKLDSVNFDWKSSIEDRFDMVEYEDDTELIMQENADDSLGTTEDENADEANINQQETEGQTQQDKSVADIPPAEHDDGHGRDDTSKEEKASSSSSDMGGNDDSENSGSSRGFDGVEAVGDGDLSLPSGTPDAQVTRSEQKPANESSMATNARSSKVEQVELAVDLNHGRSSPLGLEVNLRRTSHESDWGSTRRRASDDSTLERGEEGSTIELESQNLSDDITADECVGSVDVCTALTPWMITLQSTKNFAVLQTCVQFLDVVIQREADLLRRNANHQMQPEETEKTSVEDESRKLLARAMYLGDLLESADSQRIQVLVKRCSNYFHNVLLQMSQKAGHVETLAAGVEPPSAKKQKIDHGGGS